MSQLLLWFLLVFCTDPQSTSIWSNPILGAKTARIDRPRAKVRGASICHWIYSSIPRTPRPLLISLYSIERPSPQGMLKTATLRDTQSSANTLRNANKEVDTATQSIQASRTFRLH